MRVATKCKGDVRNELFAVCSDKISEARKEESTGLNHPKIVLYGICACL